MTSLSADAIREAMPSEVLSHVSQLKTFGEIDSTNSYLMQVPGPAPGKICIAVTSNQTAGRGRHGKVWQSPPGSGVCLSAAYTFAKQPENLPALTLAIGLGVVTALESLGADGVGIKWPNDLVAQNKKLGGILTEVQPQSAGAVTVVTGVGVNLDIGEAIDDASESGWSDGIADLKLTCAQLPTHDKVAATLTEHMLRAFVDFDSNGLQGVHEHWSKKDWLLHRQLVVDSGREMISGAGAGIDTDGALLIDTLEVGVRRITSGSVVSVGAQVASS